MTGRKEEDANPGRLEARREYGKPRLTKIELSLEESLAAGCKTAGSCDVPPVVSFDAGS